MPFPHEAILGLGFFSALVDAFHHHSWPSATRDGEMHQLVLRKSLTLELPHVEKIHTANCLVIPPWHWNIRICCSSIFFIGFSFNIFNKDIRCKNKATIPIVAVNTNKVLDRLFY